MTDQISLVPKRRFKEFHGKNAWEQRAFSNLVTRVSKSSDEDALPRIEYEDIISGQGKLNKDIFAKESDKKGIEFEVGDTLFGKLRPYLQNWFLADFKGIAVGDWWVLRPSEMDSKFIYSLVQSNKYQIVANLSTGTKMPRSDWKVVSETEFAVPDKYEQKKIGGVFEHLDNLITLHQGKLKKTKALKSAYLSELFPADGKTEPKRRFSGFTEAWEENYFVENIKNTIDFRGRTPKKLGLDWSETGYLALSALNVKNGYIDFSADVHYGSQELYDKWMSGSELRKGQVLFTTEAPMGNVAQVPDDKGYILSQRTIAFDVNPEKITDDFLAALLRSPKVFAELSALSSGGTAKGVSQKSLSHLKALASHK